MARKRRSNNEIRAVTLSGSQDHFLPSQVTELGEQATKSFLSFFTDNIRNRNTREAYFRAATRFFAWCEVRGLSLELIESFHVSTYIEELGAEVSVPTVKQHLAALRMLFDWLIVKQVIPANPCHAVRGPSLRVETGKTPALDEAEAKQLLLSISTDNLVGLRDRALIALMTYTFARISAALSINVEDYFPKGKRYWIRLHEKGGREHSMPAHHKLEEYLDEYIAAAGIAGEKKEPLFRTGLGKTGQLSNRRLKRTNAYAAIQKRARKAGILTPICAHTFRATGITNYLTNGGNLSEAQKMAAHADCRTTKLYDRRHEQVSLDEIEKISI